MQIAHIANIVGLGGVVIVLIAYFLLQAHKVTAHSLLYSVFNLLGSAMVLFSLYFAWNLPSAIVETAWMMISFFGIYKAYTLKDRSS